jgi:hypothetical protein
VFVGVCLRGWGGGGGGRAGAPPPPAGEGDQIGSIGYDDWVFGCCGCHEWNVMKNFRFHFISPFSIIELQFLVLKVVLTLSYSIITETLRFHNIHPPCLL